MILQRDLNGQGLAKAIKNLVQLPDEVRKMGEASRKLARGDAAAAAVDLIGELIESRRR
jgi:UDP-N-acetylglucosamine:LPS N-acetylglucosamine transferase